MHYILTGEIKKKWSFKNIFYFILFRICILSLSIQYLNNIFLILGLDDNYFRINEKCRKFKRLFDATAVRPFKVEGGKKATRHKWIDGHTNETNGSRIKMNGSTNETNEFAKNMNWSTNEINWSTNDVIMNESTNDVIMNGSSNDMNESTNDMNEWVFKWYEWI